LRLDDEEVSHRHLYLQVYSGRVFAFDMGSRTGTFWNEERLPHGWLDAGETIRVGRYLIQAEGERLAEVSPAPADPLVSRTFVDPLLPPVSLEFVKGGVRNGQSSPRCRINRVLVFFGRTAGCKVRLMHSSVSKFHCCLIRTSRGVWVVDLLSRNGVWVNGTKVPWARLEEEDDLEIGDFVLRLQYDRPDQEEDPNAAVRAPNLPAGPKGTEGERGGGGKEEKANDGGSKNEDRGSKIEDHKSEVQTRSVSDAPSSILDPPSSTLDSSSVVDVGTDRNDAERDRQTLVVSSRRALVPAELSESIALIISNQFAEMQRQMFDQFQQAMMVMFQTFSLLHRDQMELVRKELNRVHELTRQLHELQAELAKHPSATKDPEVQRLLGNAEKTDGTTAADLSAAFNPDDWNEAFLKAAQKVMAANQPIAQDAVVDTTTRPADSLPAELSYPSAAQPTPSAKESQEEDDLVSKSSVNEEITSFDQASGRPPSQAAVDIHALLCEKIAALQAERQGRWQKIISFLAGKNSGQAVP
jgi:pSer/pThr/pTyr-binding forkhead associated (FHA) protein